MLNKAIIVDGIPGCGKTLVSSIISSFEKVELYKFCYEIEYYCLLHYFNQIDLNTSSKMIRLKFDQLIYDVIYILAKCGLLLILVLLNLVL